MTSMGSKSNQKDRNATANFLLKDIANITLMAMDHQSLYSNLKNKPTITANENRLAMKTKVIPTLVFYFIYKKQKAMNLRR